MKLSLIVWMLFCVQAFAIAEVIEDKSVLINEIMNVGS